MSTDTFTRTTPYGLGTGYTWTDRDTSYSVAADSLFYVDGNRVVIPGTASNDWDSYLVDAGVAQQVGYAAFDVYLPVMPTSSDYFPEIVLRLGWTDNRPVAFGIRTDTSFDPSVDPHVNIGSVRNDGFSFDVVASIPVDTGNWYTAKFGYHAASGSVATKLWKVGDTEPDWQAIGHSSHTSSYTDSWIDFWNSGSVEAYFDNLVIDGTPGLDPVLPTHAIILDPEVSVYTDTFTRSVSQGLGGGWLFLPSTTWEPFRSTFTTESSSVVSVNGSEVVVGVDNSQYGAWLFPANLARLGRVEFDFRPGTDWGGGILIYAEANRSFYVLFSINSSSNGLSTVPYQVGNNSSTFTATANTWYTAVVAFDDLGGIQGYITLQGDTEQNALTNITASSGSIPPGGQGATLRLSNSSAFLGHSPGSFKLDNFKFWARSPSFTADAFIQSATPSFGLTARAVITATLSGSFTTDACIVRQLTANAVLKRTQTGSFSADALLFVRHFTASAILTAGDLLRHYRDRDHQGTLGDDVVVLESDIAPYDVGDTLARVLADLWSRTH